MKVFGIDTTRKKAKVFVVDTADKTKSYMVEMNENVKHSEGLFLYIEKALLETGLTLNDMDLYACIVGPGSFTGIRVGMSTIKGFKKGIEKPVIALNTFELLADGIKSGYIMLSSTNTSCYYAKVQNSAVVESGVVEKSKISDLTNGEAITILSEEQDVMPAEYTNYRIISDIKSLYENAILKKTGSGEYGEFVPYYLQLSQAERNLKNE